MSTPVQIRKRVRELEQEIAEIKAANERDRSKHRDFAIRFNERDRKQRLHRILEELSALTDSSANELK